jgi:hypothetical protein
VIVIPVDNKITLKDGQKAKITESKTQ